MLFYKIYIYIYIYKEKKLKKNLRQRRRGWKKDGSDESEREDEGEVDEKLPSPTEGLIGTIVRPWIGDWDVVKSGWV